MLIIDCDFYVPTKLSLECLYNKVIIGGRVIIDDYPTLDGCKQAVDEYIVDKPDIVKYQVPTTGCIYWTKTK